MQLIFVFFFIYVSYGYGQSIQDIEKKLLIKEVSLEKTQGPEEFCTEDFPVLKYEKSDDNILLTIGEKIIFPELTKTKWSVNTVQECLDSKTNKILKFKIEYANEHECKNKKDNFKTLQTLEKLNSKIIYKYYRTSAAKPISYTCAFKIIKKDSSINENKDKK